jgi:adenylyltransferase/sulfurtransferase
VGLERYVRQTAYRGIRREGQEKLLASRVAVIGMGALGTVIAGNLCRSGVGFLRLIDRDIVEISNLQRQTLYTEKDARESLPKALAAAERLKEINSEITLEPRVADVNSSNIEGFIEDVDLVLDGCDNFELRFLINEACHKHKIPWIYGGALGAAGGMFVIVPGGPCFRCFCPAPPPPGSYPTCSTEGVLSMTTGIVACFQSLEALKILTGAPGFSRKYLLLDLWGGAVDYVTIEKDPRCPVCGKGVYELLERPSGAYAVSLCGQNSVQVVPDRKGDIDFEFFAQKLREIGRVDYTAFRLSFEDNKTSFHLLKDGRAIIRNVSDPGAAKSLYAEYIGL